MQAGFKALADFDSLARVMWPPRPALLQPPALSMLACFLFDSLGQPFK